ncbi:MAG: hypothetical protein WCG95_00155 [bacterium]
MAKIIKFPNKQNLAKRFFNWLNAPRELVLEVPLTNEIFNKKVQFLHYEAFKFFRDVHEMRIGNSVDFHPESYAQADAKAVMKNVIADGKVEKLYYERKRDLRRKGMKF